MMTSLIFDNKSVTTASPTSTFSTKTSSISVSNKDNDVLSMKTSVIQQSEISTSSTLIPMLSFTTSSPSPTASCNSSSSFMQQQQPSLQTSSSQTSSKATTTTATKTSQQQQFHFLVASSQNYVHTPTAVSSSFLRLKLDQAKTPQELNQSNSSMSSTDKVDDQATLKISTSSSPLLPDSMKFDTTKKSEKNNDINKNKKKIVLKNGDNTNEPNNNADNYDDDHQQPLIHRIMNGRSTKTVKATTAAAVTTTTSATQSSPSSSSVNMNNNFDGYISEATKIKIAGIITDIKKFNDIEKLYLYLQLPDGSNNDNDLPNGGGSVDDRNNGTKAATALTNAKKKTMNSPFGKKADSEVIQTHAWIQSHLEEDISVSIPKHEVYEEYRAFCDANHFEKLCVADFGKAMKHIFPQVKPRRLGQRGNSKYCYSGLRKRIVLTSPELPALETSYDFNNHNDNIENNSAKKNNVMVNDIAWNIILEWVEKKFNRKFKTSIDFARYLIETQNLKTDLNSLVSDKKINENGCLSSKDVKKELDETTMIKCMDDININNNNANKSNQNLNSKLKSMDDKKKLNIHPIIASVINNDITSSSMTTGTATTTAASKNDSTTIDSQIKDNNLSVTQSVANVPKMVPVCNSKAVKILLGPNPQQPLQLPTSATSLKILPSQACFIQQQTPQHQQLFENPKYRPIQPKPVNFDSTKSRFKSMTNQEPTTIAFVNNDIMNMKNSEKGIQQSIALLNGNIIKNESKEDSSNMKIIDKNHKRQIDNDEKEATFMLASKKRHVETIVDTLSSSITSTTKVKQKQPINISKTDICDLKINELETEALNEYLNNISNEAVNNDNHNQLQHQSQHNQQQQKPNLNIKNVNSENIVHIRRLLENHIARASTNNFQQTSNNNFNNNSQQQHIINNSMRNSSLSNENKTTIKIDAERNQNPSINNQLQLSSPNSNSFIFQPISPRDTPTTATISAIQENSTSGVTMHMSDNNYKGTNGNNSIQYKQNNFNNIQQIGNVTNGTQSQPSSEANSPFVSPRNTPVSLPRSRNNSGQSVYSGTYGASQRQTPASSQNFDSGVSSISSSPFISPQSTPIPTYNLQRIQQNQGNQNALNNNNLRNISAQNLARVRHSSGPGGPISSNNRFTQLANLMNYNRSNSLSPMINNADNNDNSNNFGQQSINNSSSLSSSLFIKQQTQQQQKFSSANTQTDTTFSINNTNNDNAQQLSQNHQMNLFKNSSATFDTNFQSQNQSANSFRQRHFSNPYGCVSSSSFNKDQNNDNEFLITNTNNNNPQILTSSAGSDYLNNSNRSLYYRSQSVPLNSNIADSFHSFHGLEQLTNGFTSNDNINNENLHSTENPQLQISSNIMPINSNNDNISKSYPATPICTEINFKFSNINHDNNDGNRIIHQIPNTNVNNNNDDYLLQTTFDDLLSSNDNDLIQSGQDLIVSSVQPGIGNNSINNNNDADSHNNISSLDLNKKTNVIIVTNNKIHVGDHHHQNNGTISTIDNGIFNANDNTNNINNNAVVFNDDLLIDDTEQFQTLDAFHDCDNDFNNMNDLVDQNVCNVYADGSINVGGVDIGGNNNDFTV